MIKPSSRHRSVLLCSSILALGLACASYAGAQDATAATPAADENVVVVTGFRSSLKSALSIKKRSAGTVDSILSEDIAKFPDSNLAESMQRIPGVTLSRGDGGEGRNISVRGLGPQFTRVRINGMEGSSQIGAADIYGAANNGRSFDFNVFPSEIFSALTARKTATADIEEGSLGATVDLRAPKPFDIREKQLFSITARGIYNEISKQTDPKYSVLFAKKFGDGKFGILGSFAYSKRNLREVGYSAVDILSAGLGGNGIGSGAAVQPFCTPIGITPVSPDPVAQAAKGATLANCSTNNPRTGTIAAYNTIMALRGTAGTAPITPGSGAFFPRIPRYVNSEQDAERMGGSLTFQWKPDANTDVSVDYLYSKFDVERRDNYIAGLSFARNVNNNGQPMVSVKDIQFDSLGSLMYGLFDGVDVRSEGLVDQFTTTFEQINLNAMHRFGDNLEVNAYLGHSVSSRDDPMRLQTFIDAIDVDNFSIDFRDGETTPIIKFGFDVANPANFAYAPAQADGTVLGGFSVQGKPQFNKTINDTFNLDGKYTIDSEFSIKVGAQWRVSDFQSYNLNLIPSQVAVVALPTGTTVASITKTIDGLDDLWGRGAPSSWLAVDANKWRAATGFDNFKYCGLECGAASSQIKETTRSLYAMVEFNRSSLAIPIRGDVGLRYYHTDQIAVGHIPVTAPVGSTYPSVSKRNEVERSYRELLPSANVVFELRSDLLARFSAAKVLARPELGNLTPSAGVTATTRTGTVNNPYLDPIRAKTFDAGLEWYYRPGSVVSVGYFYKDIESYIQRVPEQLPFNQLGLPNSLLDNTNSVPTDIFTVSRFVNTPGGPLKGYELNLQAELDFLPGVWGNFGVLANYTNILSEINYKLSATTSTTADLVGLSRESASGTLYYEDDKFSFRTTGNYRGKYIRGIPASTGSDLQGNGDTFYVDASASYSINSRLKLILEAQNLTDEQNRLFIDSKREDTLFELRNGRTITFGINYKY